MTLFVCLYTLFMNYAVYNIVDNYRCHWFVSSNKLLRVEQNPKNYKCWFCIYSETGYAELNILRICYHYWRKFFLKFTIFFNIMICIIFFNSDNEYCSKIDIVADLKWATFSSLNHAIANELGSQRNLVFLFKECRYLQYTLFSGPFNRCFISSF